MTMTFETSFAIIRTVAYLWVAAEFISLGYLYNYGYETYKATPIIKAIQKLFIALGIIFAFLSFMPVVALLDDGVFTITRIAILVFLIPIGIYSRRFRRESLTRQKMQLPKGKKK